MRKTLMLFLLATATLSAQDDPAEQDRRRTENIETILRIQDRRTVHDGKLISLLSDDQAAVRRRAYLAFASVQDTTALSMLIRGLTDPETGVQEAAAFAIGQTGILLTARNRAELEHDLIWNRIQSTRVPDRLIEEIGKFGTVDGLRDLVIRIGNVYPRQHETGMIMGIARFAIRGITDPGAVRYLLVSAKTHSPVPWEALYALQRIGDDPETRAEIEYLVQLRNDRDPLVRLNLAVLLGKFRDVRVARDPLIRMAASDGDWRVRVAAFRSLAVHPLTSEPEALEVFRRAFFDGNMHIALAAIAALRSSDIAPADSTGGAQELLQELGTMAANDGNAFPWQHQAEAAATLASLLRSGAFPHLVYSSWPNAHLQADLLRALGATGAEESAMPLLAALDDDRAIVRCGALDGLTALASLRTDDRGLRRTIRSMLPGLCSSGDAAVVATAAGMMADSLFADTKSTPDLLRLVPGLRGPDDIEALLEVIAALADLGDNQAVPQLIDLLQESERPVAAEAAAALRRMTGMDYAARVGQGEPMYTDFDFAYLHALPETIRVVISTARGDITAELYKELAPFTIMSMLKLSSQRGFYRGLTFHRVVPNFVIQGGCPRGDGWGGPGYTLRSEFSTARFLAGTIGIASAGKDTEGSQFFITHSPQPHLDGRYTIIGNIIDGQHVVDAVERDDRLFDFRIQQ